MLTPEKIRDIVYDYSREHESTCPGDGQPCWTDRCNLIAYLCHTLGVRSEHMPTMLKYLAEYDRLCLGCQAHHGPLNMN